MLTGMVKHNLHSTPQNKDLPLKTHSVRVGDVQCMETFSVYSESSCILCFSSLFGVCKPEPARAYEQEQEYENEE